VLRADPLAASLSNPPAVSLSNPPAASLSNPPAVSLSNPLEVADWDARLEACPARSFFHGAAWARVLRDTYHFVPAYLALGDPVRPTAVLPIMEVDSWLTGRRGVSLPFTDACEPLCPGADSFRRLFREALECARARRWKYLECRGGKAWFGEAPPSTSFYGHQLDLGAGEAALWSRVDGAVRRAVRKAEQSGVTVAFSQDLDAVRAFYGLLCRTRRRHGMPAQPFRFFENIHRHVLAQNQGWIVLARHGGRAVAGAVFFHGGKTAIFKFGASNAILQHLRANNLVMWEAIRWLSQRGYAVLDFGRTSLENDGLRRFKLSWGSEEHRIDYFRYSPRSAGFVTARDKSSGWHNRVFRLLPVPLSRLIGMAFYRHVA